MGSTGYEAPASEPIAVIGLACKFAGDASNEAGFWKMLAEKRSAWSKIPLSRFNATSAFHPDKEKLHSTHAAGGHFIEQDPALFDAQFFNLSTETAAAMDPQIRMQLESVYEALENAGIKIADIAGSQTSVYAGLWVHDYRDGLIRDEENLPRFLPVGTGAAFGSNRISHFFDLRGPSMTLDTGCSTSPIALHQAVCSLRLRESDMSIVAASNLMLNADVFKIMSSGTFLSPDGKSYTFDHRANGYGRGEGVATLIVKRLTDALADGDPIRAVIRESGTNQDGYTPSITSPAQDAQIALMRDCYRRAGLDPYDTQYFEAHGTGTPTGDPIEAGAIAQVFKNGRTSAEALRIGSVKTNIGHTEVTSGLAGVIKVILAMEKGQIPASINFEKANPKIPFADWKLKLVRDTEEWPVSPFGLKRASVNNFGYGGSNAHIILDGGDWWTLGNSPGLSTIGKEGELGVLTLSAKSEAGCQQMVTNLREWLEVRKNSPHPRKLLQDVLYTLGQRRSVFQWVATAPVPLSAGIEAVIDVLKTPAFKATKTKSKPRIGMVFTGQGAQWYAMGRELFDAYPVFKAAIMEAEGYLQDMGASWTLMEELHRDAKTTKVNSTDRSIPICVAMQIALINLLRSWGIDPAGVVSHSSGEVAAGYVVGALDFRSAMAAAYHRAGLTATENARRTVKGGMLAVGIGPEQTAEYLAKINCGAKAVAACINSPASVTVAGDVEAVEEVEEMMKADNIFARRLQVDAAYHSHHMDAVAPPYRDALTAACLTGENKGEGSMSIAYSSPVTGGRITDADEIASPELWVNSMVQSVQFIDAVKDMVLGDEDPSGSSLDLVIEVGPHPAMGGAFKDILALPDFNGLKLPYFGVLRRKTDARQSSLDLAAQLIKHGLSLNMGAINFPQGNTGKVLTDLPSYPWTHHTRHWIETRFNRAIRERQQAPHELIGAHASWSNPAAPCFRKILRLDDHAWLRDHAIESSTIYPGSAYICMAIEALIQMRALHENGDPVSGFRLRDIELQTALAVTDGDGIEIQTLLAPSSEKSLGTKGWLKFEVVSVTIDGKWTQHATGLILAEVNKATTAILQAHNTLLGYTKRFEPEDFYANLKRVGITYGPHFQNIQSIAQSADADTCKASFTIANIPRAYDVSEDLVMEPPTLESIFQAVYAALPRAGSKLDGPMVLSSIQSFWISSQISNQAGNTFDAWTSLKRADSSSVRASVSVIDHKTAKKNATIIEIEGLVLQSLGTETVPDAGAKAWEKELCNKIEWVQDLSLATPANLQQLQKDMAHPVHPVEADLILDLQRVCLYFMQSAKESLIPRDVEALEGHRLAYYNWMTEELSIAEEGILCPGRDQWLLDDARERSRRIKAAQRGSVDGQMVCQLGPQLAAMLRNEQPQIELMMQNRLLAKYYMNALRWDRSLDDMAMLLKKAVQRNPRARILEVGAGTGGATRHALPVLGTESTGGPFASVYHFTDIRSESFEAVAEEFPEWTDVLKFSKLDIEKPPAQQGFELGSYDIVIACRQCLYDTRSMAATMPNIRSLMKPGGTLLLVETAQDQIDMEFMFGLFPGWWSSEEQQRRSGSKCTEILQSAGFSGIDLEIHDCDSEKLYATSAIMSTALPAEALSLPSAKDIVVVQSKKEPAPRSWLNWLETEFGLGLEVQTLETAPQDAYIGKFCICVAEATESPVLYNLEQATLDNIKVIAKVCAGLVWVTKGGAIECQQPKHGLAAGFLRTMRNEYVGRHFVSLDLEYGSAAWSEASVSAITRVVKTSFGALAAADSSPADFEYAERGGNILVPRIFKDTWRNKTIHPKQTTPAALEGVVTEVPVESFKQVARPLSLQVKKPGFLDSLIFDSDYRACIQADNFTDTMIEIAPRAFGVNHRDVMVALGQTEDQTMGMECAGTITKIGPVAAAKGLAIGDAVMCLLPGPFCSRVYVEHTNVAKIPRGLSFEDAASIPLSFATAYYSLFEVARLQQGQSILIHAAAGGVGQAAIMLAQHIGATIYVTVGSAAKRSLLSDCYGLSPDNIFNSRDASFAQDVMSATNGQGVDVVLNSLTGSLLQASFDVLAPFGHFVELGRADLERNSSLDMGSFARHATFSSVDLPAMLRLRPTTVAGALAEVSRLLREWVVRPVKPLTVHPLEEAADAFQLIQSGQQPGKVVLSIDANQKVPTLPTRARAQLSPNASYLLVGGLSSIVQSLAIWMIKRGARNLILLSRDGSSSKATLDLVQQIQRAGCRVKAVDCDISNLRDLEEALDACRQDGFPSVRGVVQGAANADDSILERMTLQSFESALLPKVTGSWNLHQEFSNASDLDFLIFLSSSVGTLGSASQANQSAAASYQDALARYRNSNGLPCVSIDLAFIKQIAPGDDAANAKARLSKLGHMWLDEDVVQDIVESAILNPTTQIVTGISSGPGSHWDADSPSQLGRDARFIALRHRPQTQQSSGGGGDSESLANRLSDATSRAEAEKLMGEAIVNKLAELFTSVAEDIDMTKGPAFHGVDSLISVELRNMLTHEAGSQVASFTIMQSVSLIELAKEATNKSRYVSSELN